MAEGEVFDVFAARSPDEPMRQVGSVGAKSGADAEVFAYKLYDEWKWKRMFVVPRDSLIRLVEPQS